ncbi:Ferrochelatase [Rhodovastum atsumiense]|uniref:Ferrochelatase n=1 Tax=Rhodovastum atsumiense TaxID=504468 RepID=A0A5M6IY62_9PROT|nr:ferrochelatase [Rhodovastum atsumiense]KAA5612899.1 ferrochelatase [Rhodovastum atsumiense]CAH2601019.1 Ferrochelatase [Rhodovastum atsumiense]
MIFGRRTVDVTCTVEIEQTPESLHAHAIPDGIEIRPGDSVIVHGIPTDIRFGDRVSLQCRATVVRASWLGRLWTKIRAPFELTELYEVGFQRGR